MAEFVEVMGNIKKMCKSYSKCKDCPICSINNRTIWGCDAFAKEYPKETEEIVMKWLEEHPVKTNADKFKEVFGIDVVELQKYANDFWNQEYKESEEEE